MNRQDFNTTPPPPPPPRYVKVRGLRSLGCIASPPAFCKYFAPPHWRATMMRLSLWSLALFVLFAVCAQAQAQNATGIPDVTYASGIIAPTEDSAITANGGSGSTAIADTDGLGTFSWQWSAADTNGGAYADIAMATNAAFTPGDDEVGKFLRVCASFTDNAGNNEERCLRIATAVANINDKPVPIANTISVSTAADADNPYVFSADDFPFTDVDGDMLAGIEIAALPGRDSTAGPGSPGTLALNGTALTAVPASTITVAQLEAGALTYYPPEGEQPTNPNDPIARLAFFGFDVVDDGSDGNTNNVSNVGRIIDIRLVSVSQTAASGRPRIAVLNVPANIHTHAEGTQLRADTGDIVEPNGIDRSTLEWQWQSFSVGDGVFADISGATGGAFTPGQAHVGMRIRVCASFMDNHAMPETVEDLCSASIRQQQHPGGRRCLHQRDIHRCPTALYQRQSDALCQHNRPQTWWRPQPILGDGSQIRRRPADQTRHHPPVHNPPDKRHHPQTRQPESGHSHQAQPQRHNRQPRQPLRQHNGPPTVAQPPGLAIPKLPELPAGIARRLATASPGALVIRAQAHSSINHT